MKIKETIGIDISKSTFDTRIHSNQKHKRFQNSPRGFKELIDWVFKNTKVQKSGTLFVFEHTGLYSLGLSVFLTKKNILFSLVPGLEVKRSLGISRGKDDKVDASRIALYGHRSRDEIEPTVLPSNALMALKNLLSLRDRLVKQRAGFKASYKEQHRVLDKKENKTLLEIQKKMIDCLTDQIDTVQKEMGAIVKKNERLDQIYGLITGIKGIGPQTALYMIVYTNGFTKFKTWRKFAAYCGTAPFPNSSGTSIIGRTKVSHLAYKKIKSLLDMCAKSAIQNNPEMKRYYQKRVEEGKNKMSTINVIRNKLLARIFAVVERKTPYVDFMKYAA